MVLRRGFHQIFFRKSIVAPLLRSSFTVNRSTMGNETSREAVGGTVKAAEFAGDQLWDPSWKESYGEATIKKHKAKHDRKLYCSWFCPFAQRAWITLEESKLPYQYIEVNPYVVDPRQPGGYTKKAHALLEKKKAMPDFIKVSPRGLVPAIHDADGSAVWESAVVVEYLCEKYPEQISLLPSDPARRALARILVDHCTSRIQKAYYLWLMAQDEDTQNSASFTFIDECRALAAAMAPNGSEYFKIVRNNESTKVDAEAFREIGKQVLKEDGPYVFGNEFTAVDVAFAPFWQRIRLVGKHYRGIDVAAMAKEDASIARLEAWWHAVRERPSVKATFVCEERLLASYNDYATNKATSDFANSMQSALKN